MEENKRTKVLLELEHIKKSFRQNKREVIVLKDVSLTVAFGDMISIMGPSGSGKSTLLRIIGCMDDATEGTYCIDGKNQKHLSDKELAYLRNQKFGFIFQDFALIEEETVFENVMVPIFFSKEKRKNVEAEIESLLEKLNIGHLIDKKVTTLSGGEKQRVAIARALINHPDVLLADEPTGALDEENTIQLMELFRELNQSGISILIITHDEAVAEYCKNRYYLRDGRLWNEK